MGDNPVVFRIIRVLYVGSQTTSAYNLGGGRLVHNRSHLLVMVKLCTIHCPNDPSLVLKSELSEIDMDPWIGSYLFQGNQRVSERNEVECNSNSDLRVLNQNGYPNTSQTNTSHIDTHLSKRNIPLEAAEVQR